MTGWPMRFTPQFLDDIKARVSVSDVVRRKVKLMKSGREWKGLSPFNSEKTPSFFVNDQKMAWFDFSSGKNGNIFDFLMQTEGLSFPEAVERLAHEAGLALPVSTPEQIQQESKRQSLYDVMELAVQFFEAQLQAQIGARARGYLADRGLVPAVQRQFRMGYAPHERFALRDFLANKNVALEDMIECGLLVHGDDIPVPYDRFRERVMFPIFDRAGKPIAFGGRALDKDVAAKYLNSPETPLFHKGSVLYNHHNARKAAHDKGVVIAVEGYVDVISMTAAGVPHVVAPLGTALTADQLGLLWRMAPEPIMCFDGDRAGRKAAWRAADLALPLIEAGRSLRFAFMPDGQDPDDLARSGGLAALTDVLGTARPLVDVLWLRETESAVLDTPERRAALERRLRDVAAHITDEPLRRYYRQDFDARLAQLFGPRQGVGAQRRGQGFMPIPRDQLSGRTSMVRQPQRRGGYGPQGPLLGYVGAPIHVSPAVSRSALFAGRVSFTPREGLIMLLCVAHPMVAARFIEDIARLELSSETLRSLRDAVVDGLSALPAVDLRSHLKSNGFNDLIGKIENTAALASQSIAKSGAAEDDVESMLRQAMILHQRARTLHRELKSAEMALGEQMTEQNLLRLNEIQAELSKLDGREAVVEGFGAQSGRSVSGM
jgi:DNA primase